MSLLLQHRVKKLLASQSELTNAKTLLDSIPDLLCSEDTDSIPSSTLRQSLKAKLDHASLEVASKVLQDLEQLMGSLEEVKRQTDTMDRKCKHVLSYLDLTERKSNQFTWDATSLRSEQRKIQAELDSTKDFLQKYQVSLQDMKILETTTTLMESHKSTHELESFFLLIHRLKSIRTNCQDLVAQNPSPSSLEFLDEICKAQDIAFEKLYQWTIQHCAIFDETDEATAESTTRLLPQAIRFLKDKEEYYKHCQESITQTRRNNLLRSFVEALTQGGANGIPRPIEIHAHDPVRYAGEMLAWIHQASVGEADYLNVLFDGDSVSNLLGLVCAGLTRPMQIRLQQVIQGPTIGLLQVYPVVHVIAYYTSILSAMMPTSELAECLTECYVTAQASFDLLWKNQLRLYQESFKESLDFSLAVAHPTLDLAHKMGYLLDSYFDALLPRGVEEVEIARLVDPLIETILAPELSSLSTAEFRVFSINQQSCIQASLNRFDRVKPWSDRLQNSISNLIEELSQSQADLVVQKSGVGPVAIAINNPSDVSSTGKFDAEFVRIAVHNFCTQLMALHLPVLDRIGPPECRNKAEKRTAEILCKTYDEMYSYVAAQEYTTGILVHSPHEIRTIMDI